MGGSDVPKTFWKAGVARGKSTTAAQHVRAPSGQPIEESPTKSGDGSFL
jgi:hypothetical protein